MTATATPAPRSVSRGAIWGTLIGCCAWTLPLGGLCLVHGRVDALLDVVLPMLLASLGLGGLLVAVSVLARHDRQLLFVLLFGGLGVALGILLLLCEAFVGPLLEEDPRIAASVRTSGGVLAVPRAIPLVLLAAGAVTLAVGVRRLLHARWPGAA